MPTKQEILEAIEETKTKTKHHIDKFGKRKPRVIFNVHEFFLDQRNGSEETFIVSNPGFYLDPYSEDYKRIQSLPYDSPERVDHRAKYQDGTAYCEQHYTTGRINLNCSIGGVPDGDNQKIEKKKKIIREIRKYPEKNKQIK